VRSTSATEQDRRNDFGSRWFADADMGDARRAKRLIHSANRLVTQPGQSLPDTFRSPAELKALYRLMAHDNVSHESVLRPAQQETLAQIQRVCQEGSEQVVLVVHDDTELD
jgi:Transposase DNA-binding